MIAPSATISDRDRQAQCGPDGLEREQRLGARAASAFLRSISASPATRNTTISRAQHIDERLGQVEVALGRFEADGEARHADRGHQHAERAQAAEEGDEDRREAVPRTRGVVDAAEDAGDLEVAGETGAAARDDHDEQGHASDGALVRAVRGRVLPAQSTR